MVPKWSISYTVDHVKTTDLFSTVKLSIETAVWKNDQQGNLIQRVLFSYPFALLEAIEFVKITVFNTLFLENKVQLGKKIQGNAFFKIKFQVTRKIRAKSKNYYY